MSLVLRVTFYGVEPCWASCQTEADRGSFLISDNTLVVSLYLFSSLKRHVNMNFLRQHYETNCGLSTLFMGIVYCIQIFAKFAMSDLFQSIKPRREHSVKYKY